LSALETITATSVASVSVTTKIATNATITRRSGLEIEPGRALASGSASQFATRKAPTQPASEMTSRTSPRQAPQAVDSTRTPMTA